MTKSVVEVLNDHNSLPTTTLIIDRRCAFRPVNRTPVLPTINSFKHRSIDCWLRVQETARGCLRLEVSDGTPFGVATSMKRQG